MRVDDVAGNVCLSLVMGAGPLPKHHECHQCHAHGHGFKLCGGCRAVAYCSPECQIGPARFCSPRFMFPILRLYGGKSVNVYAS